MSVLARPWRPSRSLIAPPIPRPSLFQRRDCTRAPFDSGFSSSYDPLQDTPRGPIFTSTNNLGVTKSYPRDLKQRVDEYVVGQDRAKKTICSTIFNHYQSIRRRNQLEIQDGKLRQKIERARLGRDSGHPVEDEFPRHQELTYNADQNEAARGPENLFIDEDSDVPQHVKIDKSNLLLLGPTGVGKTYILEILSKKVNVPFTISDCNSFTQAGYIGQDVESCIERLVFEANYDRAAAEHGIVVLDEFDKIARKELSNGRDVGGEGVQQALLKLVEGSKINISVKDTRLSRAANPITSSYGSSLSTTAPPFSGPPNPVKVDQFVIDTTNILFVVCGAFVGLDDIILKRVKKSSMGFGAELGRGREAGYLPLDMYAHLPHQPEPPSSRAFTPLDLVTPADLEKFGFIPELIGRLHNICALTPLSLDELFRVLTEPRNSLVAQYTALFETYPSRLFFTRRALHAIADRAAKFGTGARGLKIEMERVLSEPMFDAPIHYVLITEGCVNGAEKAGYWGKDGRMELLRIMDEEDAAGGGKGFVNAAATLCEQFREAGQSEA